MTPLNVVYHDAERAYELSHHAQFVVTGIDPHGLYYRFVEALAYNRATDGRVVACVGVAE